DRTCCCNLMGTPSHICVYFITLSLPQLTTLFPYTTLFRSHPNSSSSRSPPGWCNATTPSTRCSGGSRVGSKASRSSSTPCSPRRSEEHTSELQSRFDLVCRLLLEKKKCISI